MKIEVPENSRNRERGKENPGTGKIEILKGVRGHDYDNRDTEGR